ncbi:YbaB/EbfC family nucleoid-associated protein [Actinoplanes sp. HUAS TT8]|uniref:YbaB/EbfC family nucleoid-associated protein n=1 Tax=Actinoplanes sp. HUAS TT8 TaxID=3447453 RepID=UPI003F527BEF
MRFDPENDLRAFQAHVDERTDRALRFSAELEAVEVTERSPGGEVTVRINSAGGLADLRIHPEADRVSREELARLVLDTSRRAQVRLAERVGEMVSSVYGTESGTAALISEAYAKRYPAGGGSDER